ncbi:MAG: hypothetical protein KBD78_04780 [Oligoflexales bacterium]|nr:hypothetical protein [Oligoflexales bacterium]
MSNERGLHTIKKLLKKFIFVCVLGSSGVFGCKTTEDTVTQRERADELLNQRRYQDARTIYISFYEKNKSDEELPILIASAYAGEAGLDVVNAFEFIKPLLSDKNSKIKQAMKNANSAESVNKNNKLIISYLDLLSEFFRISGSYPYIKGLERTYLVEAILYVGSIGKASRFYKRAKGLSLLLNITQMLNFLKDAFPGSTVENRSDFNYIICNVDLKAFKEMISYAVKYAQNSSLDYLELQELNKKQISKNMSTFYERTKEIEEILNAKTLDINELEFMLRGVRSNFCI